MIRLRYSIIFPIFLFGLHPAHSVGIPDIVTDLAVKNSLKQLRIFETFHSIHGSFVQLSVSEIKQIRLSSKHGVDAVERAKSILWSNLSLEEKQDILYRITGVLGDTNLSTTFGKNISDMNQTEFFAAIETAKGMEKIDFDATHPLADEPVLRSDEMTAYLEDLKKRTFLAIKAFPNGQDDSDQGAGLTADIVSAISGMNDTGYRCSFQDLDLIIKHAYFSIANAPADLRMGQQIQMQINFNLQTSPQRFLDDREMEYDIATNIRTV